MAKIVVSSMVSIDGYTEGAGGDVSQMPMDLAFAEHNADRVRSAGRLLFGGTTYRGMVQYWPNQVDNPDAIPEDRYIASRYATDLPSPSSPTASRVPTSRSGASAPRSFAAPTRTIIWRSCARRRTTTSSSSAVEPSGQTCSPTVWSTSCTSWSARKSSQGTTVHSPGSRRSISRCSEPGRGRTPARLCCRTARTMRPPKPARRRLQLRPGIELDDFFSWVSFDSWWPRFEAQVVAPLLQVAASGITA